MAVSPSVMASTESTSDELSPTTLILNQLKKQGVPLTNENIRRAVQANAQSGGRDIAGLVQDTPGTDNGPNVGQRGNAAKAVEGGSGNPPMVNLGGNPYGDEPAPYMGSGSKQTSAPPQTGAAPDVATPPTGALYVDPATGIAAPMGSGNSSGRNGPDDLLSLLGPAGIAAAIQAGKALAGGGGGGEYVGNAQMPSGRMMDVNPTAIAGGDTLALPAPGPAALPAPSPMEQSMQRAMAPAGGAIPMPAPEGVAPQANPLGGVRPYTPNPFDVINGGQSLPAGINPMSVPTQPQGPTSTVLPQNTQGAPRVPFRPGAAGKVPMPGAGEGLGQTILRMLPALGRVRP